MDAATLIFVFTLCAVMRKLFPGLKCIVDVETITDNENKFTFSKTSRREVRVDFLTKRLLDSSRVTLTGAKTINTTFLSRR